MLSRTARTNFLGWNKNSRNLTSTGQLGCGNRADEMEASVEEVRNWIREEAASEAAANESERDFLNSRGAFQRRCSLSDGLPERDESWIAGSRRSKNVTTVGATAMRQGESDA
jgi:hypothetical protein